MPAQPFDAVIVGGGLGGLACALTLAGGGARIALVEQHAEVGGKLAVARIGEHEIDCGPTVLTMRSVFDDLFAAAGMRVDDHLSLRPLAVLARHAWHDGSRLDLFADEDRSAEAIAAFGGAREADGFRRYVRYSARLLDRLDEPFMRHDNRGLMRMLLRVGPVGMLGMTRVDFARSMWRSLGDFFTDPRLRQLFARYATYYGSSPFAAPATLNLISAVEQRGVWAIEGGMIRLARTVAAAFVERGGTLLTGCGAERFDTDARGVHTVVLTDGTRLPCRHAVFNGDPDALCEGMLGDGVRAAVRPREAPRSLSARTWSMLARPSGLELAYHTVCFGADYRGEFAALFGDRNGGGRRVPPDPTVYLCAPDRLVDAAPAGDERVFCLINAPAGARTEEDDEEATCRMAMEEGLRRCGLALNPIGTPVPASPSTFARRFPGTQGAIYGAATHGALAAFRRHRAQTRIPNLWLVGGAIHPGAGLPMVTMGGMWVAKRIAADLTSTQTSPMAAIAGGTSTASPRGASPQSP